MKQKYKNKYWADHVCGCDEHKKGEKAIDAVQHPPLAVYGNHESGFLP